MSTGTSSSSNYRPCGSPTPMVTFTVPMAFLLGLSRLSLLPGRVAVGCGGGSSFVDPAVFVHFCARPVFPCSGVSKSIGAFSGRTMPGVGRSTSDRYKSRVSPWCNVGSSTRSGQSAALMSQKRHSCGLGIRFAGLSADSLRINAPRFYTNWSSMASPEMRTVWSR